MKIAVIGTGGVGGYFGGLLARAGTDVTFVARGEQYRALKAHGLVVKSVQGDFSLDSVSVVQSPRELDNPDVVLVATKAYDRDEVAKALIPVVSDQTVVITLQNGIDNDLQMKKFLPHAQLHPGLAYIISARTAPGVIEQTAGPRTIYFGDRNAAENPRLKQLEAVMCGAGIQATASKSIDKELWLKFLWISAFSGMTALCRCPIGRIVNDFEGFALLTRCLDEGIAVAKAMHVPINDGDRRSILDKVDGYKLNGVQAKSSLLVDLEHNRPTEIESLSGTLVRLAQAHGVSVPLQHTIYHAVRLATGIGASANTARD